MTSKAWVLVGFLCLSFLVGVVGQYYYPGMEFSPADIWFVPIFAFLIFFWYRIDTEQKSYKRSPWLNVSILAFAIVALPYYFFRSRGLKGGVIATLVMLLFLVISGVLTVAGQYSAYYGLQS